MSSVWGLEVARVYIPVDADSSYHQYIATIYPYDIMNKNYDVLRVELRNTSPTGEVCDVVVSALDYHTYTRVRISISSGVFEQWH